MNTPKNKLPLRIGLSKNSGSVKKPPSVSTTPSSPCSSDSTPKSSLKITHNKLVMTQKKLQFAARSLESDESINHEHNEEKLNNLDLESLKNLLAERQKKLESLKSHQVKMEELKNVTEKWKEAGLLAIDRLRPYGDSSATDEEILDSFKIPHDTFL